MSTIHAQKAIDQINADRESEASEQAIHIVRAIVNEQNAIKQHNARIDELKKALALVKVETIDAGTVGL